ncbi:MAG: AMP-binding protein, partial [Candidatus Dormibacteraeota bacterium]|nr:AMP-binding protein [Candidatus Dormibacteraeota bacterium]
MVNTVTEDADLAGLALGITARSVRELLALRACICPRRPAHSSADGSRTVTYADLAAEAEGWRGRLDEAGASRDVRVGLRLGEPLEFAGAFLSLLAAGRTVVPLDPDAPAAEVGPMVRRLDLDLMLDDDGLAEVAPPRRRPRCESGP